MYSESSEYVAMPFVQVSSAPVLGRMAPFNRGKKKGSGRLHIRGTPPAYCVAVTQGTAIQGADATLFQYWTLNPLPPEMQSGAVFKALKNVKSTSFTKPIALMTISWLQKYSK